MCVNKIGVVLIGLTLFLVAFGCVNLNDAGNGELDSSQNNKIVVAFYDAVKTKDYDSITAYRSEIFLETYPPANMNGYLVFVNTKLGDFQSYKVINSQVRNITNLDGHKSITTILTIDTVYAKGSAVETITTTTWSGDEELDNWSITSTGLV